MESESGLSRDVDRNEIKMEKGERKVSPSDGNQRINFCTGRTKGQGSGTGVGKS